MYCVTWKSHCNRLIQQLEDHNRAPKEVVLYQSQLVRLCFQAFLLKTEKQLPLPLTLGPHTTVTPKKQEHASFHLL